MATTRLSATRRATPFPCLRHRLSAAARIGLLCVALFAGSQRGPAGPKPALAQAPVAAFAALLLPADALPDGQAEAAPEDLSNQLVAQLFPDPIATRSALAAVGRVGGARRTLEAPITPVPALSGRSGASRVRAVTSSVAVYRSAAAAETVLTDPGLGAVLHTLGLALTEQALPPLPLGDGARLFVGAQASGPAGEVAVYVTFRHANTLGHLLVVGSAGGGPDLSAQALVLAHQQAGRPIPAALTPAALGG